MHLTDTQVRKPERECKQRTKASEDVVEGGPLRLGRLLQAGLVERGAEVGTAWGLLKAQSRIAVVDPAVVKERLIYIKLIIVMDELIRV